MPSSYQREIYKRLSHEWNIYEKEKWLLTDTIRMELVEDNLLTWRAVVDGVEGTPYEGGKYVVDIDVDPSYPYKPPTFTFRTKIWHPSIDPTTGVVCIPSEESNQWPVAMTIFKTLLSIQSWMHSVHEQDALDMEIKRQATDNPEAFAKIAAFWCSKYAGGKKKWNKEFLKKLDVMKTHLFDEETSILALSTHDWVLPHAFRTPNFRI